MLPIKNLERVYPRPQVVERPPGPWCEHHERQRDRVLDWVAWMVAVWVVMWLLAVRYMDPVQPVPTGQPVERDYLDPETGRP